MLIAFPALCSFAQWAVWASKRNDRANTVFALGVSAFVALLILNAQAFIWNQMGVARRRRRVRLDVLRHHRHVLRADDRRACCSASSPRSAISAVAPANGEILVAHAIFWYAMTAVFAAIWFLVYVTK